MATSSRYGPVFSRGFQHICNVLIEIGCHLIESPGCFLLGGRQVAGTGHVSACEEIKLDFRLGARGTSGESGARSLGVKDQQVTGGLGQGAGRRIAAEACGSRGSCSRRPR